MHLPTTPRNWFAHEKPAKLQGCQHHHLANTIPCCLSSPPNTTRKSCLGIFVCGVPLHSVDATFTFQLLLLQRHASVNTLPPAPAYLSMAEAHGDNVCHNPVQGQHAGAHLGPRATTTTTTTSTATWTPTLAAMIMTTMRQVTAAAATGRTVCNKRPFDKHEC